VEKNIEVEVGVVMEGGKWGEDIKAGGSWREWKWKFT
jgi:hypothetical protein